MNSDAHSRDPLSLCSKPGSRLRRVASVAAVTLAVAAGGRAPAQEPLTAAFDWTMPDRFGLDERTMISGVPAPDHVLDYSVTFPQTWETDPEHGSPALNPPAWRVDFDASASRGAIVRYVWKVDGEEVGDQGTPSFSHEFPAEGTYSVTLTVTDAASNAASVTDDVVVQDWLIVGIGDSYASGEGNPEPGDEDWFAALVGTYADLREAEADLSRALEDLNQARTELEIARADTRPALNALSAWNRECPSLSLACAGATTTLVAELTKLGFNQATEIIKGGYQYVLNLINSITNAAQAAVAAAQASYDAAAATVDGLKEEIQILFQEGAVWQTMPPPRSDRDAHRSSLSGQALAALAIERGDPRTSVTFVHVAFSGARIVRDNSSALVDDQIDKVKQLVGDREIDAVLVSIGGNDAGFARILVSLATTDAACGRLREMVASKCLSTCGAQGVPGLVCQSVCTEVADSFEARCREEVGSVPYLSPDAAADIFADGLEKLGGAEAGYPRLDREFRTKLPGLRPDRVYITSYPNLVEDDDGSVCPDYLTISHESWRWIGEDMTVPLNEKIHWAAQTYGWKHVEGVFDAFRGHGYCADGHWVVRAEESFLIQGDKNGVAHPNAAGHRMYGRLIAESLAADLYSGGDLRSPRLPGGDASLPFRRGEANADGKVDISDPIAILAFLFLGAEEPGCLDAADADDSGAIDISDAISLFRFLFLGGEAPSAPGVVVCGPDPTEGPEDGLGCRTSDACP